MTLLLWATWILVLSGSGCRKCETCRVFDSQGNELPDAKPVCGSKADLDKVEEQAFVRASNLSGTYSCTPE